jgi:hypothetical protein
MVPAPAAMPPLNLRKPLRDILLFIASLLDVVEKITCLLYWLDKKSLT